MTRRPPVRLNLLVGRGEIRLVSRDPRSSLRQQLVHIGRVLRLQKVIRKASPAELAFYEALASLLAMGRAGRAALLAEISNAPALSLRSQEPVAAAPPPRSLDAEIEDCEAAFARVVERLQADAVSLAAGGVPAFAKSFPVFFARAVAFERVLRRFVEQVAPTSGPVN